MGKVLVAVGADGGGMGRGVVDVRAVLVLVGHGRFARRPPPLPVLVMDLLFIRQNGIVRKSKRGIYSCSFLLMLQSSGHLGLIRSVPCAISSPLCFTY